MFKVANIARKSLLRSIQFKIGFGKKRAPTKNDLQKYDVVIVGTGLGGALSSHLDSVLGQKAKIFVAYEAPNYQFITPRIFYEKGKINKPDLFTVSKNHISKNNAHSEGIGVEKFNPDKNQIILKNGRAIQYENLVISMGLKSNPDSIKGFDQAWADVDHKFFTNADHPSWRITCTKVPRFFYNFNGTNALYYIPPAPFGGEIENYNFFIAKSLWDWHADNGKISWETSSFTIINANDTFCKHFSKVDNYIKSECSKRNISIEQGWTLIEVQKGDSTAIFKNNKTGEIQKRFYQTFYSLMPYAHHSIISDAGLADSAGLLNVNPRTLQHVKYDNVFGLGEVANVPTTKTFYGGVAQLHVLRNNLERKLKGLPLNAQYDGYTQAPLYIDQDQIIWVAHLYDGVGKSFDTSKFKAGLLSKIHSTFGKKEIQNILKFKNWGPPYYKFKKIFPDDSLKTNLHKDEKTVA